MGRATKAAARMKKNRLQETQEMKKIRLEKSKKSQAMKRSAESNSVREERLSGLREYVNSRLSRESMREQERRLHIIHTRLSNETAHQRAHRLSLVRERLSNETAEQRAHRLSLVHERLSNETTEQRAHRLSLVHERLSNETTEQRAHRLSLVHERLSNETAVQRAHRLSLVHERLSNETADHRAHRLNLVHERLSNETAEQNVRRLTVVRNRNRRIIENETSDERHNRLEKMAEVAQSRRSFDEDAFKSTINVFADVPCSICKKSLYPQQRFNISYDNFSSLLPRNLSEMGSIVACSRCSNTLKKRKVPAQAFWNKMEVTPVPEELADLSDVEQRLLCRVIPFLKIIKVQNRFSQDWCKGQVILFAKDVIEIAEQLPLQLNQARLIIVAESLDNLHHSRQFQINTEKLKRALQWLLANNSLYKDVRASFSEIFDVSEIVEIADQPHISNISKSVEQSAINVSNYVNLNENIAILRGSFHQGTDRFDIDSRGRQCTGIATVACVAFSLVHPNTWSVSDIDYILILGDKYYRECIASRINPDVQEENIDYLAVSELLSQVSFNHSKVNIIVSNESALNGHIDNDDTINGFPNLRNALIAFFGEHRQGILTTNLTSVALYCDNQSNEINYWLLDSHSRGPKGCKAPSKGVSCCMRFYDIDDLHAILRRNLYCKNGNDYTANVYCLTPLTIIPENGARSHEDPHLSSYQFDEERLPSPQDDINGDVCVRINHTYNPNDGNSESRFMFTTSMLRAIDEGVPEVHSVVSITNNNNPEKNQVNLVDIQRKTAPPLNLERERRMEELGWYFLFPDGKNGFGEEREVPITPLDYFQARIMSCEKRFQRTDYLFFALSVVEYFRAKSSVSVSCIMRQGEHTPKGLVDNMHLTMRNIRGSASYWQRCCSELIAMVRSLGPPTWFLTFSCNDLNWIDMLKALLIADNRNPNEAKNLTFSERLALVQRYPVVIARQFTLRVNALVRFIKNNPDCLGGHADDLWYRIEFQNRGSPHLHMLIWCGNVPDFSTREGIAIIEKVVSCSLKPDNDLLRHIVESVQIHKHTNTCYKERSNGCCRFGFPRPVTEIIVCLDPDETLANNGRFILLKRTSEETMVNNYNPVLLSLWEGNMDIQPCGSVTAVAYYVAKYASKCEPNDTGDVVREAISKAKRRGGTVWNQLFAVSMAILSQRLVSAPECAYRLCHLPLKMSSRKAVFVNSCKPEERFRILRFEGDETSYFNNIFDRYVQRPDILEVISLAEFAVRYETVSNTRWTEEEDGDIELIEQVDTGPSRYIILRDNTRMRVRSKPAVLRTRYYTLNSDREGYYYNLLVCHIPFRNESDLMLENESSEACFLRRQQELRPLLRNMSTEQFAHAEQVIQQALAQAVALNAVREIENHPTRDALVVHADEQIFYDQDDFSDVQEDPAGMPDDIFVSGIRSLNVQQRNLFQNISTAINKDINNEEGQTLLFITGGAGSGKSFVLKLLVEHVKRCYGPTVDTLLRPTFIEVASLTGVAARQIFGKTLHAVFSLPIEKGSTMTYRRMSGQRLEQERRKWSHINWLIIDEISMVSYENLRIIHLRLQEFKNNEKLFGGVNILLFGDIMQLPPVKGHWCFTQPPWCSAEINLWHQFSFCELTINMRQQNDMEFVDLLNNLRFGDLTTAQLELLCERKRIPLTGEFADGIAVRIYPTIRLVDEYNSKMTDIISKSSQVYSINAIDESREASTYGKRPPSNVIPTDINNCGGLLHKIQLAEGSRVMLRRNLCISDGLVNGIMGIIHTFKWPALRRDQLEEGELPEAVLIKFDDSTIGNRLKDSDGCVAISPVTATFQATKGYGDVERRMLPLILSWAVTVHKLQGTTLDKAVIDLGKKVFAKGQVYVALSRVKTLDGLAISNLEPRKLLNRPHDENAFQEMERLRTLVRESDSTL